ncbi:MAG: hypothetical protein ACI835_003727 [Planctomycetota bacterium]
MGAYCGEAMPVCWSPDGTRVWFAFLCGQSELYSVDPVSERNPTTQRLGHLPRWADKFDPAVPERMNCCSTEERMLSFAGSNSTHF